MATNAGTGEELFRSLGQLEGQVGSIENRLAAIEQRLDKLIFALFGVGAVLGAGLAAVLVKLFQG